MQRMILTTWTALLAAFAGGCMSVPLQDNPSLVRPATTAGGVENPLWVPSLGVDKGAYAKVYENTIDIINAYGFELRYANRWDGHIETFPRIAPGYEQFWKPGSPDCYQRLEATLQTIRHRGEIQIDPAPDGGFFVYVTIYKELEDLARPTRMTAGGAAFRSDFTVDRQFEVIDASVFESNWIPRGRDTELEQLILRKLKKCM